MWLAAKFCVPKNSICLHCAQWTRSIVEENWKKANSRKIRIGHITSCRKWTFGLEQGRKLFCSQMLFEGTIGQKCYLIATFQHKKKRNSSIWPNYLHCPSDDGWKCRAFSGGISFTWTQKNRISSSHWKSIGLNGIWKDWWKEMKRYE